MYTVVRCSEVAMQSFLSVGDKGKIEKLVQMAWTFMNDRYVYNHHCNRMMTLSWRWCN